MLFIAPSPPKWLDDIYAHAMTESFFVYQCILITALSTYHQQANKQLISSTSALLTDNPYLTLWASVLSYRLNVLCSTLSWRRSALFLSLNLDVPSDCGKLIVSGLWLWRLASWQTRVSSWRTLTLIVMPTNSIFRTRAAEWNSELI